MQKCVQFYAHFLSRNFHAKMCPILYRLSFGQKSKPIALLFGQKLPIFVPKFLCKNLSNFIPPQFWAKIQAYSLTFWPNIAHFLSRNLYAKICPILYRLSFGEKSKPIALLFGHKLPIFCPEIFMQKCVQFYAHFLSRNFHAKMCPILYRLSFGQKSKPIALLFGQKLPIFVPKFLCKNLSNFIPPQFWAKIQAYSLTFWPNIAHFLSRNLYAKICPILYRLSFGQKSKPIALLFGQKLPSFCPKFSCKNLSNLPPHFGKTASL